MRVSSWVLMRVRWRLVETGRGGEVEVREPVDPDALMAMLMVETGKDNLVLKHGFPPRDLNPQLLRPMDTIQVYNRSNMRIMEMAEDNSCLFHAFCHLIPALKSTQQVRQAVAQLVYGVDEAILRKSRRDYAAWIQSDNSWGGAIEIMLLSEAYDICIRVVDVQSGRIDEFNANGKIVAYLLYSGIHYDLLSGTYSPQEQWHREEALRIAKLAKLEHRYTDLTNLKCDQCGCRVNSQASAQRHAQATGHQSFSEE